LDPGSTNIIDLYVVTLQYYTAYQNWIKDSTGTVPEPLPPTIDQLTTDYAGLQDYKMISDNVIVNSVEVVPLNQQKFFGDLYEIRSAPNQIFVNAATVNNVEVIQALTSTNLRTAPGSGVI